MGESKVLYGFWDGDDFSGIVWETKLGKIVTCEGKLNLNNNLMIKDAKNNNVDNIDLRNILMEILPR